ncbi:hypothetical protein [Oceanidesulfovibrio marinus]|uniref:Holliday junction resolvasome RuvABC endonuclease subunit n=1 Tax=Oceanidesulfovibrio marinus TaxID=370038 RepID=A0A6P1ZB60_9BACT|nr:hypothetical protein [Oceanidesulfovibrio marinus]TVM31194.1 hypothetical protein DQK91_18970 [Oceanidesulfovibrio marinus]
MNKPTAFIGIDPGKSGAIALLAEDAAQVQVLDYPGTPDIAASIVRDWCAGFRVLLCALERVQAFPKQGASSTFVFGTNYGIWQGILATLGVPHVMPTPREWQKGLVRKTDGTDPKGRTLAVARRLFPPAQFPAVDISRKKHDGRADALLLAWWARKQTVSQ